MDGDFITYEQATGAQPFAPLPPPNGASADDSSSYAGRELTVRPRRADVAPPSTAMAPIDAPTGAVAKPDAIPSDWISYEDAVRPPTPHPGGPLSNSAEDGWLSGAAKGTGTAAVKAVGNIVGAPTALHGFVDYLMARVESKITGKPTDQILTELAQAKKDQQQHAASIGLPVLPDLPAPEAISGPILSQTGEYAPTTKMGRMAQAGTEAALSTLGPGAGIARGTAGTILRAAPGLAAGNAVAGSVGQGVTEATGDPLYGMLAGGLAVPPAGAATAGVRKATAPLVMGTPGLQRLPYVGGRIGEARDLAAGQKVLGSSDDPAALRDWAAQPEQAPEVPGSPRTLAGTIGDDRKLFQAEKAARGSGDTAFGAIDDAQAAAQKKAITAPYQDADVFRPGQVIRDRLNAIDAAHDEAVDRLKTAQEDAVAGRKAADEQALDRMTVAFADAHSRATQAAQDAAAPLDAVPHPEVIGTTYRTAHAEATEAARQAKQAIYDAVDPEGTLATAVTPLKEATAAIRGSIDPHVGVQPSGAEARLHADIARMPDVISFQALQKLDSRATAAMKDARRNPNPEDPEAIIRLTRLKGAVLDAIHSGTENAAAHERELVARGLIEPENTVDARVGDFVRGYFERQHEARVAVGAGRADEARGAPATPPSGLRRTEGAGGEGFGGGRGSEGAPPPSRSRPDQPEVGGNLGYQAPDLGSRTVSARMHAPETAAALGQDVPGTVVRPYGGPLDARVPAGQPGIVGYHGTPHDFERFSSAHIGSGEGNQAYGRGLYFAENEGIARGYRDQLSTRDADVRLNNQGFRRGELLGDVRDAFDHVKDAGGKIDTAIQEAKDASSKKLRAGDMEGADFWMRRAVTLEDMKDHGFAMGGEGHIYQVKVNRPSDHFLDWDRSLKDQSPQVRKAVDAIVAKVAPNHPDVATGHYKSLRGGQVYQSLANWAKGDTAASKMLADEGVAGVRYLDAGSRSQHYLLDGKPIGPNDSVAANAAEALAAHGTPEAAAAAVRAAAERQTGDGPRAAKLKQFLTDTADLVASGRLTKAENVSTHNMVTFNDHDIVVTHKDGQQLARPVELPQFLMGTARAAWGEELKGASVRGDSFSPDLTRNALKLVGEGRHLDHGVAYASAFFDGAPQEVQNAILGRTASAGRGQAARDGGRGTGPGQEGEAARTGFGWGEAGQDRGQPGKRALAPNFDPGAVDRLSTAKSAHIDYERTYKNPIVEPILATNGYAGQYTLPSGAIPAKAIVPGGKGYETAKAFIDASGRDPRAIAAMQDASVSLLRNHFPPAGTLHPNAVSRWKEHLDGALRAIDEVAPGFSSRFDNAANATQAMLDLGLEQKQAISDFRRDAAARALQMDEMSEATMKQGLARAKGMVDAAHNSPAGKFLGQGGDRISPVEVENAVGNMLKTGTSGATRMRSLVASVASDPDALAGVQKAGTDWMARTFATADDGMAGAKFITFYRDNKDVLIELYGTAHTNMIGGVASDMERNARWRTTTAAKSGSDTSANMRPWLTEESKQAAKHISLMTAAIEGLQAGYHIGGLKGAAVAAATPTLYLLHNLRSAGIHSVDALYREALANPEVARRLISKMPAVPEGTPLRQLVGLLRRELIVGPQEVEAKRRAAR